MKRQFIIFTIIVIVSAFLFSACGNRQNETADVEKALATENEYYEIYEQVIFNEQYNVHENVHEIHLTIVDKSTGEETYNTTPCRAFDYHGVEFVDGSNDFVVKSSDVGDLCYEFNESIVSWSLKE